MTPRSDSPSRGAVELRHLGDECAWIEDDALDRGKWSDVEMQQEQARLRRDDHLDLFRDGEAVDPLEVLLPHESAHQPQQSIPFLGGELAGERHAGLDQRSPGGGHVGGRAP
jgi:hypothetical protein